MTFFNEDKAKITKALFKLVKLTRAGIDIKDMEYVCNPDHWHDEYVIIRYKDDYIKRVSVAMDSGAALIRDVMREVH